MSENKKEKLLDRKPWIKVVLTFLGTLSLIAGALYIISLFYKKETFLQRITNPRWLCLILLVTFGSSGGVYAKLKKDADKKQKHKVINDRDILE